MMILGALLLIAGFVFGVALLWQIGLVILVLGLFLLIVGSVHGPVGGRRYWW